MKDGHEAGRLPDPPGYGWHCPLGLPHEGGEEARRVVSPDLLDDGPWGGVSLGGVAAGSIGRTHRGDFARWHLDVGRHRFECIGADRFAVFMSRGGGCEAHVLSAMYLRPLAISSIEHVLEERRKQRPAIEAATG